MKLSLLTLLSILLGACSGNEFAFQETKMSCTPPQSSARYGKNIGPIIMTPDEYTPFSSRMTVAGTCVTDFPLTIHGPSLANGDQQINCVDGKFSQEVTFKGGDGNHQIDVYQPTMKGQDIVDTRCFTKDTTPPKVTIAASGNGAQSVGSRTIRIEGVCESGLEVTINGPQLVSPANTDCNHGHFSTEITFNGVDGLKDVVAHQTDRAGNQGQDDQQYLEDTVAPVVTITAPAAMSASKGDIVLTGTCESDLPVDINEEGGAIIARPPCAAGKYSAAVRFSAADGIKHLVASQTDASQNRGEAKRDFVKDTTAPVVKILLPKVGALLTANTFGISGSCENGLNVNFSGGGLAGVASTPCTGGAFNTNLTLAAPDGNKEVIAKQTDAVGNEGSDSHVFVLDTVAPVVRITSPAANSSFSSTLTLQGTCESGLRVDIGGAGAQATSANCSAATFSATVTLSAGDGAKTVTASQTDPAGHTGSDSRVFVRDSSVPHVTITTPAPGTVASAGVTLGGTCEAAIPNVNLSGGGLAAPVNTPCAGGTFTTAIQFSAGDGTKTITAAQTDGAGNVGSDSRNFVRDSSPPHVAITSPPANSRSASGLTLSGICESGLTVNISGGVNAPGTTACNGGAFSQAILFSAGNGTKDITVSQTDGLGNVGSDTRRFIRVNNAAIEVFSSRGPGGKVDILFVDDNSSSMDPDQTNLGNKFGAFTSALAGIEWQIGIITTDCTAGSAYNFCGQLMPMIGRPMGENFITPATPSFLSVFKNTIQRPETKDCLDTHTCPSSFEEGLKSTIQSFNLRNTNNADFFRNDADLAVIVLSDENEQGDGKPTATKPADVVSAFRAIWGAAKKLSGYGIIIKPTDPTCLKAQRSQAGNSGEYGTFYDEFATLTGGFSASICAPDYSVTLDAIGDNVTQLNLSYDLAQTPKAGTVKVTFTPAFNTTWTVTGNRIAFAHAPPLGTKIEVAYEY